MGVDTSGAACDRIVVRGRRLTLPCALAVVAACKSSTPSTVVLSASGGLEGAPFAGAPAVARVELRVRPSTGGERVVSTTAPSTGGLDVPDSVRTDTIGALSLVGLGADGAELVYGRTPPLELAGLDQTVVPITIFVQRIGAVARALELPAASAAPIATSLGARYFLVSDATSTKLEVVDLLDLGAHEEPAAFDAAPSMVASAGSSIFAIDAHGVATTFTIGSTTRTTPAAPPGASFGDVVGGAVIVGDDGAAYLVGATRSSAPSDVVIRFGDDGSIAARKLTRARASASAAWVKGRGLVVVGGASSGDAPGVELLASGATTFAALAFAADATRGAVLSALDDHTLLRVSPDGTVAKLDLACTSACAPVPLSFKAEAISARDDDRAVALDRGGVLLLRAGRLSIVDAALGTLHPLGEPFAPSVALSTTAIGATMFVVAGDPIVRAVR